ncbi:fibronectin type III domain-containing protein, partial [Balneolaceae bacterium YR4-1]
TYYWRVQANEDGDTGNWSSIRSFSTAKNSTPAVSLLSPSDGATDLSTTLTFEWEALSGIGNYQFQLASSNSFSSPVTDVSVSSTTHEVSGLENGKTYYWRVQAAEDGDTSNWSSIFSFGTVASTETNNDVQDSRAGDEVALEALWVS